MRVLYIDGVGPFGGASRSLYETVRAIPAGAVDAYFVVQRGTSLPFYRAVSRDVIATLGLTRFDNSRYSHYRGMRWLVPLRELFYVPFTIVALLRARWRWGRVDVLHANEVSEILPLLFARWLFGAPTVVHVRSLARIAPCSRRARWFDARLRAADAVVAIDENVRVTLPADLRVDVVHNSFTPEDARTPDPTFIAMLDALPPGALRVGFVGNLHVSKGVFDLLDAAEIVRRAGRKVSFVIIGGVTMGDRGPAAWLLRILGMAQNVQTQVEARIASVGLGDCVQLLGASTDIQCVYERIDVLCFPSHFDAPGRPVLEAAFSSVPSIVAVTRPFADTLADGETGLAIPGRDPQRLAEAIIFFADNPGEAKRMGKNARDLAERNHSPRVNAAQLLSVYERITQLDPRTNPERA